MRIAYIITASVGFLTTIIIVSSESPAEKQSIYSAWCKQNNSTNITFAEWEILRSKDLLDGQSKTKTVPIIIPIHH